MSYVKYTKLPVELSLQIVKAFTAGYKQTDIADYLGITQSCVAKTIQRYTPAKPRPDIEDLHKFFSDEFKPA